MSASVARLRPEALPLQWTHMSDTQQRAFAEIVGWLAEAAANLSQHDRPAQGRELGSDDDGEWTVRRKIEQRRSAVGLISGQRGTGKTSLMLSLMSATLAGQGPSSVRADLPHSVKSALDAMGDSIIWLEPLDVDTLPRSTNLLAAILARVLRAMDQRGVTNGNSLSAGLLDRETRIDQILTRFERLRNDIALGWRRDVPDGLDPDAFAVEVNRTEIARLQLGDRFGGILDSLAVLLSHRGNGGTPLFVLPIDDIDLNPRLCFELLQLVRQIATPRLFTLVLGDIDNTEMLSRLALAGEYANLARGSGDFSPVRPEEVAGAVRATASRLVRKLLPPAQRVMLEAMLVDRALAYQPTGEKRSLGDLLKSIPALSSTATEPGRTSLAPYPLEGSRTLADLLLIPSGDPRSDDQRGSSDHVPAVEHPYWGVRLLAAPPRQVTDLWYRLSALGVDAVASPDAEASQDRRAINLFIDLLKTLIQEEQGLSYAQQSAILSGFQRDAADRPFFHTDVLMLEREMLPGSPIETRFGTIRVREGKRWKLGPWLTVVDGSPKEFDLPKHRPLLEDRTAAGVMLVHDLLTLTTEANVVGRPLASAVNQGPGWIATEWRVGANRVLINWPEPDWLTFREFDLFDCMWRAAARGVWRAYPQEQGPEKAEVFLRAFISCIVEAAAGRWAHRPPSRPHGESAAAPQYPFGRQEPFSWPELLVKIREILPISTAGTSNSTLPITLACALAPEASLFLTTLPQIELRGLIAHLEKFWSEPWCKRAIRHVRVQRARTFFRAGGGNVAQRLLAPQHYRETLVQHLTHARRLVDARPEARKDPDYRAAIEAVLRPLEVLLARPQRAVSVAVDDDDLRGTVSFLRDALDGLPGELVASLDHPINRACDGDLCPRVDELERADLVNIDASGEAH